jgi:hypothetical protein
VCLELSQLHELPKRLEFLDGRIRRICQVAWTRGYLVGLNFEATKPRATIEGGLSRPASGLSRLSRRH